MKIIQSLPMPMDMSKLENSSVASVGTCGDNTGHGDMGADVARG